MVQLVTQANVQVEKVGAIIIFAAGSLLHFAYEWSGAAPIAGVFSAVNESTWEHMKIAFWPGLAWAGGNYLLCKYAATTYWAAHSYGLLTTSLLIPGLFYAYTFVLGRNHLFLDIAVFFLAIALGRLTFLGGMALMRRRHPAIRRTGIALLALQVAAYASFTYSPPENRLFQDPRNGLYGAEAYAGIDC